MGGKRETNGNEILKESMKNPVKIITNRADQTGGSVSVMKNKVEEIQHSNSKSTKVKHDHSVQVSSRPEESLVKKNSGLDKFTGKFYQEFIKE